MSIISIAIQKGGSGKTTTTINLGAALARSGKNVLLVDADPQANLSQSLGIEDEPPYNLYTELKKEITRVTEDSSSLPEAIIHIHPGMDVIPASIDLAVMELELVSVYGREQLLSSLLQPLVNLYDFILIDCPHAIGMLTVNALVASNYVLIPLPGEFLPLKGVFSFMRQFDMIRKKLNSRLELLGILLTKFDERKLINISVKKQLEEKFPGKVFQSVIRTSNQLVKAQEAGKDIFCYDKSNNGAKNYQELAEEVLEKFHFMKTAS